MEKGALSALAQPGAELKVRVTPRAGRNEVSQAAGRISVRVTAPPEDGKANAVVQSLLARALGIAKSRLTLIRGSTARDKVFPLMVEKGDEPAQIVELEGLAMVSDAGAILDITRKVVDENPKPLQDCEKNSKAANKYIGLVRKAMGGTADVKVVREAIQTVIRERLGDSFKF
jgi:uncharacterized protein YggU (UPF0235/DUF167 family)